ncbi:MAG: site-specific integrase [Bacteroidaceae bacterium]|nr:site-specific integrase [Bacteroidaceae bacterium]
MQGKEGVLYFQIIHGRTVRCINTAHRISKDEWDNEKSRVILPAPQSSSYSRLQAIAADTDWEMRRFATLEQSFSSRPIAELVMAFRGECGEGKGLFAFMRLQAERLKALHRERSSETMMQTLRSFMQFRGGIDISLPKLSHDVIAHYEAWLKRRGVGRNTIGFYVRVLQTAYNNAVADGLTPDNHPFRGIYKSVEKTVKRAISIEAIRAIRCLDLRDKPSLETARDILLFSFYMRGMSFVDMAYLNAQSLRGTHIVYRRMKTGQQLTIEVTPEAKEILDKYENGSHYLLPIIKTKDGDERIQYKNAITMINRHLKKIGAMASLPIPLTTYVMRHSWATIARNKGIHLSIISEALGHDSEATTRIYLDSISSSKVDEANRSILDEL